MLINRGNVIPLSTIFRIKKCDFEAMSTVHASCTKKFYLQHDVKK